MSVSSMCEVLTREIEHRRQSLRSQWEPRSLPALAPSSRRQSRNQHLNSTTLEGQTQSVAGNVKEAVGKVTGDDQLQAKGAADQFAGDMKQVLGSAEDAISNPGPLIDRARTFARERPWATAILVGALGLALINTLRGKKRS